MNRLIAFLFTAFIMIQPLLAQDEISENSEYSGSFISLSAQ